MKKWVIYILTVVMIFSSLVSLCYADTLMDILLDTYTGLHKALTDYEAALNEIMKNTKENINYNPKSDLRHLRNDLDSFEEDLNNFQRDASGKGLEHAIEELKEKSNNLRIGIDDLYNNFNDIKNKKKIEGDLLKLKNGAGINTMSEINEVKKDIKSAGYNISKLIQTAGNAIGLIVFLIFGIQYMMVSNKKKVELKERGVTMVVGAIIFFGSWNILFLIYKFSRSLTDVFK